MKKIIAMLLCVAMIAAMSVSAFAKTDSLTAPHSYDYYWNKLVDSGNASNGFIRDYAAGLASAKSAYSDAKDAFTKAIGALGDAQARAVYSALTTWYNTYTTVANIQFMNALRETMAEFNYNLQKEVTKDDFNPALYAEFETWTDSKTGESTTVQNSTWYEYNEATWPVKEWPASASFVY